MALLVGTALGVGHRLLATPSLLLLLNTIEDLYLEPLVGVRLPDVLHLKGTTTLSDAHQLIRPDGRRRLRVLLL